MYQEVAAARGLHRGILRIGSFRSTSSLKRSPTILAAYRERHQGIEVQVEESNDSEVAQWLLARRIDVGFASLPDERFGAIPVTGDQLVARVPANHPLASGQAMTFQALCGDSFILTGAGSAGLIDLLFAREGLAVKLRYRKTKIISILGMIERGEETSIVAELALPENLSRIRSGIVKLPLRPTVKRRVGPVMRHLRYATPPARALLTWQEHWLALHGSLIRPTPTTLAIDRGIEQRHITHVRTSRSQISIAHISQGVNSAFRPTTLFLFYGIDDSGESDCGFVGCFLNKRI